MQDLVEANEDQPRPVLGYAKAARVQEFLPNRKTHLAERIYNALVAISVLLLEETGYVLERKEAHRTPTIELIQNSDEFKRQLMAMIIIHTVGCPAAPRPR